MLVLAEGCGCLCLCTKKEKLCSHGDSVCVLSKKKIGLLVALPHSTKLDGFCRLASCSLMRHLKKVLIFPPESSVLFKNVNHSHENLIG